MSGPAHQILHTYTGFGLREYTGEMDSEASKCKQTPYTVAIRAFIHIVYTLDCISKHTYTHHYIGWINRHQCYIHEGEVTANASTVCVCVGELINQQTKKLETSALRHPVTAQLYWMCLWLWANSVFVFQIMTSNKEPCISLVFPRATPSYTEAKLVASS